MAAQAQAQSVRPIYPHEITSMRAICNDLPATFGSVDLDPPINTGDDMSTRIERIMLANAAVDTAVKSMFK